MTSLQAFLQDNLLKVSIGIEKIKKKKTRYARPRLLLLASLRCVFLMENKPFTMHVFYDEF